jgi:type II secretory pathway pseudopilin PulG
MAVVLAIIAVLAAVLTPIVTGYLDQARVVRATGDVKTIADALRLFYKDTGYYPVYSSLANARTGTTIAHELVGPGDTPATTIGWAFASGTSASLITQLNQNIFGLPTGSQVTNPGKVAYRGPYIGALDSDPWGNAYVVTADNLTNSGTNWAFVVSAGPNGQLDTSPNQANTAAFALSGDDIVAVIK